MTRAQSEPAFTHEIEIGVPPATVHAFLCDLHNYVELHPLIESIRELPPTGARPDAHRFRVVDRIPFGPFRLRTTYTAELAPIGEREVHGRAWQTPGVRLHSIYRLEDASSGTRVLEEVSIEAPWGLRGFVVRRAREAHCVTLQRTKAHLERTGANENL